MYWVDHCEERAREAYPLPPPTIPTRHRKPPYQYCRRGHAPPVASRQDWHQPSTDARARPRDRTPKHPAGPTQPSTRSRKRLQHRRTHPEPPGCRCPDVPPRGSALTAIGPHRARLGRIGAPPQCRFTGGVSAQGHEPTRSADAAHAVKIVPLSTRRPPHPGSIPQYNSRPMRCQRPVRTRTVCLKRERLLSHRTSSAHL